MKRRKGLACSSPLCPDSQLRQKLEGDIYNIFPYIEDPKHIDEGKARAFTLTGLIDAVFLPIIHTGELDRIPGTASHELAHFMLGSAMVACEERVLVTYLLGEVWQFLFDADGDVHLLIPSFTIVGPAGKDFELARRAEQLCRLLQAREPVHEIVARAIQVGSQGWDHTYGLRQLWAAHNHP